jgi:hypothetical protein
LARGIVSCIKHQTVVTSTNDSGIHVLREQPPFELEQYRAASVHRNLAEGLSIEQILPHQSEGLFDLCLIKRRRLGQRRSSQIAVMQLTDRG